ncbi:hypothetical protein C5167_000440 [Papaver somniferum]|uniref:Glutamyl-tRNA reductase n=1 Tax=Papaver somniferum TaxID=3469 RepID=A0A4Y7KUW9_PAPSO|nr:glutamyl-tRNA reductase 2-like [Papaver somniferum]RZC76160.1 hypothetical protein C5167_000440 [Papaver somniferum]
MAAAIGFSTSVAGTKTAMESLIFKSGSSSTNSLSQFRVFHRPIAVGNRRIVKRGISLNPRGNFVPDKSLNLENKNDGRVSSLSTLEQLQNSGIDRYSKEKSSIVVVGLSFHTAPVEMREKLVIPEAELPRAVEELAGLHHIEEAAVLSTCNRMEIYVVALSWHRGITEVTEWMAKTSGIPAAELRRHLFILRDKDAIQHLFEVSAGLDSLVLGEGQILSQVKQVSRVCGGVSGFGRKISGLFRHANTAGKRVRTDTDIASGAVSVSSAAVELALRKLPASSFPTSRMLVIGAGKMGKLVIKHLVSKGCTQMVVVNRSEERVALMRKEFDSSVDIIYKPLTEMFTCASEADVIFTSTASETPLFMKEHVEGLPPVVGGLRLFIDISVPRNVGSCVSELDNAKVFNVDDLEEVVAANKEDRRRKAMEAQVIISEECKKFENWTDTLETVPTIKKLRAHVEGIIESEFKKFLAKMGVDFPETIRNAVQFLTRGIMNKILAGPTKHLRCDGSDSRTVDEILENMRVINRIFNLGIDVSILEQKIRSKTKQSQK